MRRQLVPFAGASAEGGRPGLRGDYKGGQPEHSSEQQANELAR